ncbi:MAG: ornithine carbamoyltransferase [Chloroflexi bacterium RBG_16_68_14]|nr:MAG: ornithine carbamoyltransferase [Chloroflexi bacterium RBG_16_68_14]
MRGRDLISIADLSANELEAVLSTAARLKRDGYPHTLEGQTLALLFEKPSLRTRVSFDVAMQQLGGHTVYLSQSEVGLGQREPVADVARVLSRYVQGIVARTYAQETLVQLAEHASVPVINALSDDEHPCQALADLLTVRERKGGVRGIRIAFIGDGNNVAASLAQGSALAGAHFAIASPPGYRLREEVMLQVEAFARASGGSFRVVESPQEAAAGADVVYTDVWTSMGQEDAYEQRLSAFAAYQVTPQLMALARPDAIFMHDLPAHRGEETVDEVIEGPQSVVFDQAENRLHAQRAVLLLLLGEGRE